ncbi:30S ribosomal protein S4 [Candidatus Woesearchaeota archaeon]|nr:30S ribosomal protein S4 [Candidatus Woesearchaeota archaeon]MBL7050668.1 30S ribosomal protein S4 [Candidatus Woesearchaeota archaeon]
MGDPKKRRKKFSAPSKRWEKDRIDEEKSLIREYGLKNKKEIWKFEFKLRNFSRQAKRLVALKTAQAEKEKEQLLLKLKSLSLLSGTAKLENILDLQLKDLLDRRLQTVVYKKGLARSVNAARQLITHGHIFIDKVKITVPSYTVLAKEDPLITYSQSSPFSNDQHPERIVMKKAPKPKKVIEPKGKYNRNKQQRKFKK